MNLIKRIVIFAVNDENMELKLTTGFVQDFKPKRVLGSYKGILETSFVANADTDDKLDAVIQLAKQYNQESVLIIDEQRRASLFFIKTGQYEPIGDFRAVDAETAKSLDNWTLDGTQYYAVLPTVKVGA